jgi:hypothetical protein
MLGDRPEGCTPLPPSWGDSGRVPGVVFARRFSRYQLSIWAGQDNFPRAADTLIDTARPIGYSWATGTRGRFHSAGESFRTEIES